MIATWMVYASVLGLLLGLAALALEYGLRPRRTMTRWIWIAAMVATASMPLGLALRQSRFKPVDASAGVMAGDSRQNGAATSARSNASVSGSAAMGRSRLLGFAQSPPAFDYPAIDTPTLDRDLLVAWLLSSLGIAGWWARALFALRRQRREWTEAEVDGTPVWVSRDVGPALFGIVRPQVVLPQWALQLDPPALALMLEHEAEHRRARDPMLLGASALMGMAMPWNPALWWQVARLRLAIEIDCDARVLKSAGDAHAYASLLVGVGERMSTLTRFAPAFAEHRSLLERRIVAISEGRNPRRIVRTALAMSAAALCVAIACAAPAPAGAKAGLPPLLLEPRLAPQLFYPRTAPMGGIDASTVAWLRAALGKYYPAILSGDTSYMFVSLYVNDRGVLVNGAARPKPANRKPGDTPMRPEFFFLDKRFRYGGDSANKARAAVVAEWKLINDDLGALATNMEHRVPVGGFRTVFPQTFEYDSTQGVSVWDPFLGADPRAFQWDDDLFLGAGTIRSGQFEVHVLMFKPGRGTPTDFGHHVRVNAPDLVSSIAPNDTAAYSSLGSDAVNAVARCKPPACRPYIRSGPGRGELLVALDSASKPGEQMQWHQMPEEPPPGGQAFQDSMWRNEISQWEKASRPPVVLVDGVQRTFAWVRANVGQTQIWGIHEVSPAEAMKLSHDPGAANGAVVITTKAHAPPPPR